MQLRPNFTFSQKTNKDNHWILFSTTDRPAGHFKVTLLLGPGSLSLLPWTRLWSPSRLGLMVSWHQGGVLTVYKPRLTSAEWLLADARPNGMLPRARPQALIAPIPANRISLPLLHWDGSWNYMHIHTWTGGGGGTQLYIYLYIDQSAEVETEAQVLVMQ